ncbi:MAG: hypothetical protein JWM09_744 [Francisellaceae bacterium]|nr:hypothetical protein [Francisellaceae bacterium]
MLSAKPKPTKENLKNELIAWVKNPENYKHLSQSSPRQIEALFTRLKANTKLKLLANPSVSELLLKFLLNMSSPLRAAFLENLGKEIIQKLCLIPINNSFFIVEYLKKQTQLLTLKQDVLIKKYQELPGLIKISILKSLLPNGKTILNEMDNYSGGTLIEILTENLNEAQIYYILSFQNKKLINQSNSSSRLQDLLLNNSRKNITTYSWGLQFNHYATTNSLEHSNSLPNLLLDAPPTSCLTTPSFNRSKSNIN